MNNIQFTEDDIVRSESVFSEQVHEDFPSKKDVDALTPKQLKAIYLTAPFGYFRITSEISNYFEEKVNAIMTASDWKEFDRAFKKILADSIVSKS